MIQTLPYMLAAILVGATVSIQPAMNAVLAKAIGSAYGASAISIAVAFASILIVIAVVGVGRVNGSTIATVPWWVFLAGVAGTIFVVGGVVIAPITGTLVFFVCIVAGQLIGSAIVDHFGTFGLAVREISAPRMAGIALVLAGAILTARG